MGTYRVALWVEVEADDQAHAQSLVINAVTHGTAGEALGEALGERLLSTVVTETRPVAPARIPSTLGFRSGYAAGYEAGRADRLLGHQLRIATSDPNTPWRAAYAEGYRDGWNRRESLV